MAGGTHIPHSTFHIPHSTFHIPHSTFHIPHSTFHIPHSTFHRAFIVCTIIFLIFGACSNPFYPTPGGNGGSGGGPLTVSATLADLPAVLANLPASTAAAPHTVKLLPPFTINSQWEDVNTKVKEAAKYVILDLSECGDMSTTVNGTYPNPYGNNMNIIMGTPTIKGIILPPSLTSIGDYAFGGCRSLTSITILSGVFNIGEGAFFACSGLTNVIIPDTVISIGNFAFDNTGLTNITIPPGVNSIGNFAFRSCAFTSIIIPNGVDSIGNGAFEICVSLTNITISASVTSIGNNAFESCDSLTSVTFEPGSTIAGASFGSGVFPEDYGFGYDIGGETLRTAYLNPGGGAGTYTREENGSTWTKVP